MGTALEKASTGAVVRMDEWRSNREEAIRILKSSLYPGAADQSVELVLAYCEAARLDVMQKPVHIVPMSVKTGRKNQYGDDEYEMRDVIMPGIGLYRVQASRTEEYAGMSEPEFGPAKKFTYRKKVTEWVDGANGKRQKKDTWQEATVEHPEWCKVTCYRLVGGHPMPFPAVERWLENYATAGRHSVAPNNMWERRPYAQLVKCAEAQALRKAFPEIGAQPTAEEIEGRHVDIDDVPPPQQQSMMPQPRSAARKGDVIDVDPESASDTQASQASDEREQPRQPAQPSGGETPISAAALNLLRKKAKQFGHSEASIAEQFGVSTLDELPAAVASKAMAMAGPKS